MRSTLALLAVLAVLLTGCSLLPTEEAVLEPPLKEPPEVKYDTIEVSKGSLEKVVEVTAYFISVDQHDMSFPRTGRLKEIYVHTGDDVKTGTLLAELETAGLSDDIRLQEIAIEKQQIAIEQMQKDHETTKETDAIARKRLETDLAAMKANPDAYSASEITAATDSLETLRIRQSSEASGFDANLAQSRLDLESAKVKLAALNKELTEAQLIAPIDGEVNYTATVTDGENVDAYKNIVRVANPMILQLQYSDDKVSEFVLGAKVDVTIDSAPYAGEVVMVPSSAPSDADEKTKKSVRFAVENLPADCAIGGSAKVKMLKDKRDDVIVLDRNLIHSLGNRNYVLVLEDGLRKERDIELGLQTVTQAEITGGLEVGELVIR